MSKVDYKAYAEIIRARVPTDEVGLNFGLKVGRDGRCSCVFCNGERGDTLRLYPGDRGYYCFRCHAHGDVISFYQQLTGCGFRQAIEDLNSQYGLGFSLSGADQAAMEKAKAEANKRRKEREEKQQREKELFEMYLNAADAVYILEELQKTTAPETTTELWKQRFVISLRYLSELRDYRDRLFDEIYKM